VTDELTFGTAETDAERRAAYELRYTAIVESRWKRPDSFPERIERDADDEDAVHLVSRLSGQVVGTMRLIVEPSRVGELLRQHELDQLYHAGDTMFVGRLTVARPHRSRSREVTVGLYAELIRVASERGIRRAITFLAENAVRFYRRQGFPLKLVGPPREDTGVERRPAVFDVEVLEAFMRSASANERTLMIEHGAPPP
jgi:N-acyl-L-homoserine lactone synthetase